MSSIATAIYAVNHVAEWDLYRRSSLGAHNDYMGKSLKKFIPLEVHHLLLHSIRNSSTMTLSLNIVYCGVYIHYTFNLSVNAEHNHRNICIYIYTYIFILGLSVRNRKRHMFYIYFSRQETRWWWLVVVCNRKNKKDEKWCWRLRKSRVAKSFIFFTVG